MRGKRAKIRPVTPDPKYKSEIVAKIVNRVMQHGKKTLATELVHNAIEDLAKATNEEPMQALDKALGNVKPTIEVRSRRVGGATYQVPVPVEEKRQQFLAISWLVEAARSKTGTDFGSLLAKELISAHKGEGEAMKKKQDVERMADANKAFAHFRW